MISLTFLVKALEACFQILIIFYVYKVIYVKEINLANMKSEQKIWNGIHFGLVTTSSLLMCCILNGVTLSKGLDYMAIAVYMLYGLLVVRLIYQRLFIRRGK